MRLSSLHFGHASFPLFGTCTALGVMGALLLSQVTARRARLDPDKVWDAVVAIGVATLVISRVLLVAGSFSFFLDHPLLVLTLPTINDTGLLLTAAFAIGYLRWKQVPLLAFLDALTPCAALLWGFLSLGRLVEGTREGMPTASGWVQPVELYTVTAAAVLCAGGLRVMRAHQTAPAGQGCALGCVAGGVAVFMLDFLWMPAEIAGIGILDPVQWLGLTMIVVGCSLWIALPALAKPGSANAL